MNRVKNKIALITGGSQGIGAASAQLLSDEGAIVIITDINDNEGEILARDIGVEYYHLDVTSEDHFIRLTNIIEKNMVD